MNKQDLKNGMILETRDGKRYLLVNDIMRDFDDYIGLNSYNNDLTYKRHTDFDIVKVYKDTNFHSLRSIFKNECLSLLWEREEVKLTNREIKMLKAFKTLGYVWIARDKNGALYTFFNKPFKKHFNMWTDEDEYFFPIKNDVITLDFIKWEDKEPTKIDDLLKGV